MAAIETIRRSVRKRAKIHHIYFALALFDLVAVGMGLYLNSQLNHAFTKAVQINFSANQHLVDSEALRELVKAVIGPSYSVFQSKDAAHELASFEKSKGEITKKIAQFRTSVSDYSDASRSEVKKSVLERLGTIEIALQGMIARCGTLLARFRAGDITAAADMISEIDSHHQSFLNQIDALLKELRYVESNLEADQLVEAQYLRHYEYVLGFMMILMVCVVAVYGHKLGQVFQRSYDELHLAHAEARKAEIEARALAERLQLANEDITSLNVDLANSIVKLKDAQDEIIRKGKLAQLGQLTGTVAYEIRTPLGSVRTAAVLVERKIRDKGLGLEQQLERINNGITRCDRIIAELLDFARSMRLVCKTVAVDEWVRRVVDEETKILPPAVRVSCDLGLGDTGAALDADHMRRVIVNLLSNASQAMVGKGRDTRSLGTPDPKIIVTTRRVADTVEITVTDNGPGIAEENLPKILEPLFSTKAFGTGLGLSVVEKILQHHGGGLRIKSTLGEGTAMTAWFPVAQLERRAA
ncbi:MAG TPA: ATP-binding protein [Hyphomicrobiaceae bacterium]|nr:ATP-binding protein [Hyphomicrobiaceae bacterium]